MVAIQVMEITSNPDAGIGELQRVLENDVSLSARMLRLVNSAAYGIQQRVTNLQTAIGYLGFRQVRNLALTASISEVFKKDEAIGRYNRVGLWKHLVSVGIASRLVAMRRGLDSYEDVFLAGLLHDIGIILEDQYDHANFTKTILSLGGHKNFCDAERAGLEYTHADLGVAVGENWRFPDLVVQAVRHHHAVAVPAGAHQAAIRCVQLGNALCTFKNISSIGVNLLEPPVDAVNGLSLSKSDIEALLVDLDEEFQRNAALFTL